MSRLTVKTNEEAGGGLLVYQLLHLCEISFDILYIHYYSHRLYSRITGDLLVIFATKLYLDNLFHNNHMTRTGLWQEIFATMRLSRILQKFLAPK